jgi:glycosyltransferase involved in cell wall biosynthesis
MPESLASVVIPVYNGERFLGEAIGSVWAQSYRPLEIIVVDDGSTDGSARVAKSFSPVVYVHQANSGQAAARNHGVELARGELLAFLDADDVWLPDKLSWQMAALAADPNLDAVFGNAEQFLEPGTSGVLPPAFHVLPAQLPSAMLIRRERFQQVGGYLPGWRVAETIDWYARALEFGLKMSTLDRVVYRRRIHGRNLTLQKEGVAADYLAVVRAALGRSRVRPPGGASPGGTGSGQPHVGERAP